jgi:hypothetical protein
MAKPGKLAIAIAPPGRVCNSDRDKEAASGPIASEIRSFGAHARLANSTGFECASRDQ